MPDQTDTETWVRAVRSSHDRFSAILRPLSGAEVEQRSYEHRLVDR